MKKSPIVVVLGHIDHGKTSLLDAIRKTKLTQKEAGGITQSIGAYQVDAHGKRSITFIDTPGHAAFEKIRSHGAKAADIALLVIAADEGIKPQTLEALQDIKKTNIPFIVVLNKIDKPEANAPKVKQDLALKGVMVEGWGGQVPVAEVSASTGKGIKELLDLILLLADVEGLNVDEKKQARGIVISSGLDSKRGISATLIVKEGVLRTGEWIRLESTYGKIRAMENFKGERIKSALPSTPLLALGIKDLPETGEEFFVVGSEKEARGSIFSEKSPAISGLSFPKEALVPPSSGQVLKLIVKAAEAGSLDAVSRIVHESQTEFPETQLQIIAKKIGDISTSDIDLADHFSAAIIGFHVNASSKIKNLLKQKGVSYKLIRIIYEIGDILKELVSERFAPRRISEIYGELSVLAVYITSKKGQVIGGKVLQGILKKNAVFEIKRQNAIIGKGEVRNLQQDKKDAKTVEKGKECGLLAQSETPIQVGDILVFSS